MLLFALFRFRNKSGDAKPSRVQVRSNKAYIAIWITISFVINLFLFVHPTASAEQAYFNEAAQTNNDSNALVVVVTARQWEWTYSYPQYGLSMTVDQNGNDDLVLPVNRPVKFILRSYDFNHWYDEQADVIHSFWIPAFGIKTDVVPGETRYEYVTPTQITSTDKNPMVRVQCAEVCGPGHPYMETQMAVVSSADFSKWVQDEKKMQSS